MWKLALLALLAGSVAAAEVKSSVSVRAVLVTAGTYDAARAQKVLAATEAKVLGCYKTLVGAPRTGVAATAKLKLAANGKVSAVTVLGLASSETDPVHNCVADALSKLKFAAPKAGEVVDLEATFAFTGDLRQEVNEAGKIYVLGSRPGGGGTGVGTIGLGTGGSVTGVASIGRYGTIGGGGGYGIGGMTASGPTLTFGMFTVTGALDQAIVRRILKRNVTKLRYCYEKELVATPGIEGTVRVELAIAADGTVASAAAAGLGNANIERCIAGAIQGILFPKPQHGSVTVAVPVTLKTNAPVKP